MKLILRDFFPGLDGVDVLSDVAHEKEGLVLRQHRCIADVVGGDGKFKFAFGFVPQLAIEVANKDDLLVVFDHFFDGSPGHGVLCVAHGLLLVKTRTLRRLLQRIETGTTGRPRTCDLNLRKVALYPSELRP